MTANPYAGTAHTSLDGPFPYAFLQVISVFSVQYFNYLRNSSECVLLPLVELNLPLPPVSQLLRAKVMVHKVIVQKVIVVVMGKFRI